MLQFDEIILDLYAQRFGRRLPLLLKNIHRFLVSSYFCAICWNITRNFFNTELLSKPLNHVLYSKRSVFEPIPTTATNVENKNNKSVSITTTTHIKPELETNPETSCILNLRVYPKVTGLAARSENCKR
jgi:hypothetical protein